MQERAHEEAGGSVFRGKKCIRRLLTAFSSGSCAKGRVQASWHRRDKRSPAKRLGSSSSWGRRIESDPRLLSLSLKFSFSGWRPFKNSHYFAPRVPRACRSRAATAAVPELVSSALSFFLLSAYANLTCKRARTLLTPRFTILQLSARYYAICGYI